MFFQGAGEFVETGSRGHDIVHYDEPFPGNVHRTFEYPLDVALAHFPGQCRLRHGIEAAAIAVDQQGKAAFFCQEAGNFQRLIEATLFQSLRGQGNGHQTVGIRQVRCPGQHHFGQPSAEGQLMAIFETMNEVADREGIAKPGKGCVKPGRLGKAGPADRRSGGRLCANRAAGWR